MSADRRAKELERAVGSHSDRELEDGSSEIVISTSSGTQFVPLGEVVAPEGGGIEFDARIRLNLNEIVEVREVDTLDGRPRRVLWRLTPFDPSRAGGRP